MAAGLAELLSILLPWIARMLVVSLVCRVLVAFGLSFVAWHFAVSPILDLIKAQASGMPSEIVQWLGMLQFDRALTVICSAYVIRFGVSAVHLVKS